MPKLPAVVEKLDVVPEAQREFYVEQGGKYVLDLDVVEGHPLAAGGKKALDRERTARETAERELQTWKAVGLTPEQIAEIKAKAEQQGGGDHEATQRLVDKRVKEALDKVQPQLDRLAKVEAENQKLKLTDGVRAAFLAADGIEEDADDAVRLTEDRFKLNDRGRVVVVDEDGDESSVSPKEWFAKDYKKQKPKFFKGSGGSGSGAREAAGAGAGEGVVVLTPDQASDAPTYRAALAKVGGDHSKVQVKPAA